MTTNSPAVGTTERPALRSGWLVLVLLAAAQFMVVLDATIVNIALPAIEEDLGFAGSDLQWVINAYVLAFGGLLLLGGRLTDLFAGRTVFLAGLILFCIASLACGLATSPGLLLAGRAAQGVGGALLSPAALALLTRAFTGSRRAVALGVWGAISGVAGAVGVLLGGFLTDGPGWPWIFYINLFIGAAVLVGVLARVPHEAPRAETRLDLPGAALITAALVALVLAVVRSEADGWTAPLVLGGFATSAVLLALFILVERRVRQPLVPLDVFRLRNLAAGNAVNTLLGAVLLATFFLLTLYLQQVHGDSAREAGLAYLPLAAASLTASAICSQLLPRTGLRLPLVTGMLLLSGGMFWFSRLEPTSTYTPDFLVPSLLWGAGLGLAAVAALSAATQDLGGEAESGLASGLVNTTLQVGGAVGLAVLSTLTFDRLTDRLAQQNPYPVALLDGLTYALQIGAAIALAGAALAALTVTNKRRPPADR
ncbi:DHA2 family efflux MFS transporter permease subunit [Micromonospora endolithica]|nr:DHA2 family efflux MFS transporter permease subunit [Micromonospora endolithica]TWJ24479.1 EmrB/QacA subfamily drug resistance transporter [Micromonospora endolithica]